MDKLYLRNTTLKLEIMILKYVCYIKIEIMFWLYDFYFLFNEVVC